MSGASVVTLIGVGVVVVALAAYLATIAYLLKKVNFTLGTVLIGVRSIANQTEPVGAVVDDIVDDVVAIQRALEGLLARARQPARTVREPA
jgi:uncharacterized protein YoxC